MRAHLVVNPASAGGRTGRHFDRIAKAVQAAIGEFECSFTRCRGDAVALARDAALAGAELVVAVGGDGTASEVVDGLVEDGHPVRPGVAFGFIPRGTGGDLRRTLGYPADTERAARILSGRAERELDLGRIEFVGHDGQRRSRHFANVAGGGISGRVVQRVERMGKALGGKASFAIASAWALVGWNDQPVRWRVDGGPWRDDRVTAISVCNGRFFGGGMLVAPGARIDDGLFDVVVWRGLGLVDFALKRGMLYDGSHVTLPNTQVVRASVVEVEPLGGVPVLLDVDGEQPGTLPARFSIVPAVLRVPAADP